MKYIFFELVYSFYLILKKLINVWINSAEKILARKKKRGGGGECRKNTTLLGKYQTINKF